MKAKLCYQINDLAFAVSLAQTGPDEFIVIYGKQVDAKLDYAEAAAKLGQAIMHALACSGKLDNSEAA